MTIYMASHHNMVRDDITIFKFVFPWLIQCILEGKEAEEFSKLTEDFVILQLKLKYENHKKWVLPREQGYLIYSVTSRGCNVSYITGSLVIS